MRFRCIDGGIDNEIENFSEPLDTKSICDIRYHPADPQIPDSEDIIEFYYKEGRLKHDFPFDTTLVGFYVYINSDTLEMGASISINDNSTYAEQSLYGSEIEYEVELTEAEKSELTWFLLKTVLEKK